MLAVLAQLLLAMRVQLLEGAREVEVPQGAMLLRPVRPAFLSNQAAAEALMAVAEVLALITNPLTAAMAAAAQSVLFGALPLPVRSHQPTQGICK